MTCSSIKADLDRANSVIDQLKSNKSNLLSKISLLECYEDESKRKILQLENKIKNLVLYNSALIKEVEDSRKYIVSGDDETEQVMMNPMPSYTRIFQIESVINEAEGNIS